ncbi:hypothetical protein PIB30_078349 [Stylosanthes scabra]|uniref:CSC1/OSCA1-like N-terminal transmembrane domain-containing protein n=1 Tax=Stylosanthes scabra TaxID=79078 RepID=A0ABU6QRY9_9FABA|nr:hypothetical protein [Stylosanthes scabra]
MIISALLTSVGLNTALCVLFFVLYSILRKQPSNYEVYVPRLLAEGTSKRRSSFNLERLIPSPGWVAKAWRLSEEELLSLSGLDGVVFMCIITFRHNRVRTLVELKQLILSHLGPAGGLEIANLAYRFQAITADNRLEYRPSWISEDSHVWIRSRCIRGSWTASLWSSMPRCATSEVLADSVRLAHRQTPPQAMFSPWKTQPCEITTPGRIRIMRRIPCVIAPRKTRRCRTLGWMSPAGPPPTAAHP